MFQDCTSLVNPPDLSNAITMDQTFNAEDADGNSKEVTVTAEQCFHSMFKGCTSLKTPPVLPATELSVGCYKEMFYNCTALTKSPDLPAITLNKECYRSMFYNCTNLTTAGTISATTLAETCCYAMFSHCINLETGPVLNATALVKNCYGYMFDACSKLKTLNVKFTTSNNDIKKLHALDSWVRGIKVDGTTGNFYISSDLEYTNDKGIYYSWVPKYKNYWNVRLPD